MTKVWVKVEENKLLVWQEREIRGDKYRLVSPKPGSHYMDHILIDASTGSTLGRFPAELFDLGDAMKVAEVILKRFDVEIRRVQR